MQIILKTVLTMISKIFENQVETNLKNMKKCVRPAFDQPEFNVCERLCIKEDLIMNLDKIHDC